MTKRMSPEEYVTSTPLVDGKPVEEWYLKEGKTRVQLDRVERVAVKVFLVAQAVVSVFIIVLSLFALRIASEVSSDAQKLPWLAFGIVGASVGMALTRRPIIIEKVVRKDEGRV